MKPKRRKGRVTKSLIVAVLFACLLASFLGGCVSLQTSLMAVGLPAEHRLVARPFLIFTTTPLAENDPLIDELHELRRVVRATLELPATTRPIEIYIFDDRASYDSFISSHYPDLPRRRAFFVAQDHRELVYAFRDERLSEDLRHEACHALVHAAVGPVPLWLDEGLAEYFETPAAARGMHPRHIAELQAAIDRGWRPSLTRLESLTKVNQMTSRDYREAWGWVYFLIHGSPEGRGVLFAYLRDLRSGAPPIPFSSCLFQSASRVDTAMVSFLRRLNPDTIAIGQIAPGP